MTHGYSLRPKAKGRKSTDVPEDVRNGTNGTCQGNAGITDESEGGSAAADDGHANSHNLPSSLNPPTLRPDYGERRLEAWRQRGITTFSKTIVNGAPTTYRVEGPPQTLDDIQEGRRRAEARHRIEALRIQRKQLEQQYRQDLCGLHDRIAVLRHECEEEIAVLRWGWRRARAIDSERGEAVEAEEGEEEGEQEGEMDCDVEDQRSEVASNCVPTEAWSMADNDDDDQCRRPTRSLLHWSHSANVLQFGNEVPETVTPLRPPPLRRLRGSPLPMAGPSCPRRPNHGVQPLRRQPAQLMAVPSVSPHPGTAARESDINTKTDQGQGMELSHV